MKLLWITEKGSFLMREERKTENVFFNHQTLLFAESLKACLR